MIVVTGAAGFIGSAFVWELNQKGVTDILCVDTEMGSGVGSGPAVGPKWKNLSKLKFADYVTLSELYSVLANDQRSQEIKSIFHIGACSSTTEMNVDFLMNNNFECSKNLWSWCAENKKQFVYASSCATYGAGEQGFDDKTDSDKLRPLNPYGFSKVLFDRWAVRQTQTPANWAGLRYSNVFGPQEYHKGEQASVVFKAFHQIKETGRLKLFRSHRPDFKDGQQKRDFIYIKDVTNWMYQLYQKPIPSGIYNMGYGSARTWLELAQAVFNGLNVPLNIDWIDIPPSIREHYQYFTEAKMEKLWGHGLNRPRWTLEDGISDYVKTYLSQHDPYL